MSLTVSPELLAQAEAGEVAEADFVATVRDSLPFAYRMVERLTGELASDGGPFADNHEEPPSDAERGQLLRAMASDSIRGSLERHFGVRLAFMNCHRVAVFPVGAEQGADYQRFVSMRAQLLNQTPELRSC
ncbi:SCO5389 family protein [Kitasatospora sp. NBC_01287]|uniref:SCO5389 family protein n=1 Tax=Kitasatospora sp. NBC_01287 TaxID=2903573 RepID=UPI0022574325|nr:SCO5389 family protein [Kitasatospora sp. NBC_01287]MCX4745503.1 SCO5389 family protein [Kitasatospora sp. NBC_01287]